MQTFESGGALLINRRLRVLAMALGIVTATVSLPPLLGLYLLVVA